MTIPEFLFAVCCGANTALLVIAERPRNRIFGIAMALLTGVAAWTV